MSKVLNGIYEFEQRLEQVPFFKETVSFSSNEKYFDGMQIGRRFSSDHVTLRYGLDSGATVAYDYDTDSWSFDLYRTVKFVNQTVSDSFYAFINSNATLVSDTNKFKIYFYRNGAEKNRVDKTNYLDPAFNALGVFKQSQNISNISISIWSADRPKVNYAYIPSLERYYFITSIDLENKGLWRMSLECDMLMSAKEIIPQLVGFVERSQKSLIPEENSKYIIDDKIVIGQGQDISVVEIPNQVFDPLLLTKSSFYMTGTNLRPDDFA